MTTNPWIGLDSYREGQILYGRSREIRDLSMAVFYNRQTIVYGRSGTGKSSLLHAGIFPEARLRGCLPISIRFDHSSDTNYREQLIRTITAAIEAAGGEVQDLLEENHQPESLWEFFHRYQFLRDGKPLTPLLVVDQFEEIFTLSHRKEDVQRFFTELGDLLNDVMPDYLQQTAVASASTDTTSIFGNMTFQSMESRYLTDPSYHLVLVLRDDYLSYLERYSQRIPALKQNRYGLMPITYQQALEIIMQPRPGLVSSKVADAIIRHIVTETDLNDETPVDAAILSLFLSRLYEKKGDNPVINLQLVNEQGEALLEDFYAEVVAPLDRKTVYYLEDILINADGHRENVTLETLFKNDWCRRDVVETLEASHLLRLFSYGDVQRVEYAHDVLCPIIVHRKEQRENEERYKRSQYRTLFGYLIALIFTFIGIFVWVEVDSWTKDLKMQRERLYEMESKMITRGCQDMLDEHDIYGAIRLILNSMPEELTNPSDGTIEKERLLRQAIDSLCYSENRELGKIKGVVAQFNNEEICISKNEKLLGLEDYQADYHIHIYDTKTGAPVYDFTFDSWQKKYDPEYYATPMAFLDHWKIHETGDIERHRPRLKDVGGIKPCALIAVDSILLECYIRSEWESGFTDDVGLTRMAIALPDLILRAKYNEVGDSIAVLLRDSTYLLFSTYTGQRINANTNTIRSIIERSDKFNEGHIYSEHLTPSTYIDYVIINSRVFYINNVCDYYPAEKMEFSQNELELYEPTDSEIQDMRKRIDSMLLPEPIDAFNHTYLMPSYLQLERTREEDFIYETNNRKANRINYPFAFNAQKTRIVFALLKEEPFADSNNDPEPMILYGYYPHAKKIFFVKELPLTYEEVKTIHFTTDEKVVVINAGTDKQLVIYLPSLPDLVEECKAMFFDWKMSDEERYQTYIHLND